MSATHRRTKSKSSHSKTQKREREEQELARLDAESHELAFDTHLSMFNDLPLCSATRDGLASAYFSKMTPIQSQAIPAALKRSDILAAAPTGSGKTLAFLIPVLDLLYRNKWNAMDGLGALIISPTRELAVQIFDVLRKIGSHHFFSAGLIIGGKPLREERERLSRMNIVVATPGRLLQHMDQTVGFEADNLQLLVLDEADRILDLGFASSMNAIVGHLPPQRQTLLFSATQTRSVQDLARLSLKSPHLCNAGVESHSDDDNVDGHDNAESSESQAKTLAASTRKSAKDKKSPSNSLVPKELEQHYMVVPLENKLNMLWSFIKTHLSYKTIVFISACKQVRHIFETFRHLRPGVPLMQLHGKQKQMQRLEIYDRFCSSKHGILFATDIASRGLDFPGIDWVIQLDCPEDSNTYIHRVGRTARYHSRGKSLLFLLPSEVDAMTRKLKERGLHVDEIKAKQSKQQSIQNSLQSFAFQYPEIKFIAQRAFVSYVRSVYLQKDKEVFKFDELPLEEYAASLGLVGAPKVKFVGKGQVQNRKNAMRVIPNEQTKPLKNKNKDKERNLEDVEKDNEKNGMDGTKSNESEEEEQEQEKGQNSKGKTKWERMFNRKNQSILSDHWSKLVEHGNEDKGNTKHNTEQEEDDFITLSRRDHALEDGEDEESLKGPTSKRQLKRAMKLKSSVKGKEGGTKLVFDEDGESHPIYELRDEGDFMKEGDASELGKQYVETQREELKKQDIRDRALAKEKKREKKLKRKYGPDWQNEKSRKELKMDEYEEDATVFAPLADDISQSDRDEDDYLEARALEALQRRQ